MGRRRKVGGKAAGLESLISLNLRVPQTFVVSARARDHYGVPRRREKILPRLKRELTALSLASSCEVAVRSSAATEDGVQESLAGRYESHLHVRGVEGILEALRSVWTSGGDKSSERMDVLVQQMIEPAVAGASFSRNPVTGADEVVVEAVEGTSESFLQGGVTPRRWTIQSGTVSSDWDLLPTGILREIVETSRRVAQELRYPADLEWAYDGKTLWWLQVRPITSLRGLPIYSNRISREYLPGLVKPLVWSINVPMINGAWVDLFERVVGPLTIDPLSLAKQFHYRAYFSMSGMGELFRKLGLPEDALEQLLGLVPSAGRAPLGFRWKMLRHFPRLVRFAAMLMAFHRTVPRWEVRMRLRFAQAERELAGVGSLDEAVQWADMFLPLMRETSRKRIVSLLLHMAVGGLAGRAGDDSENEGALPAGVGEELLALYDPSASLRRIANALEDLPTEAREALRAGMVIELPNDKVWRTVQAELQRFMERFGHVSESGNDFSAPCWEENPASVLRLALQSSSKSGDDATTAEAGPSSRRRRRWSRRLGVRRVDRERIGLVASRGFHLLRLWSLRCGGLLLQRGWVSAEEDIFLLSMDELRGIVDGRCPADETKALVEGRKTEMGKAEELSLPDTVLGDDVPEVRSGVSENDGTFRGIGTSRGIFEGDAQVIRSMKEFEQFRDGRVLVIPYSDIAWSPLFARAGAIIAEAGGLLSHSSIAAREAGIPAVVSVSGACTKLEGKRVFVNGRDGTIRIVE